MDFGAGVVPGAPEVVGPGSVVGVGAALVLGGVEEVSGAAIVVGAAAVVVPGAAVVVTGAVVVGAAAVVVGGAAVVVTGAVVVGGAAVVVGGADVVTGAVVVCKIHATTHSVTWHGFLSRVTSMDAQCNAFICRESRLLDLEQWCIPVTESWAKRNKPPTSLSVACCQDSLPNTGTSA